MNVGWRFADILIVDAETKSLGVDVSLVNDVLEQHGGGGEPFMHLADKGDRESYEASFRKEDRLDMQPYDGGGERRHRRFGDNSDS